MSRLCNEWDYEVAYVLRRFREKHQITQVDLGNLWGITFQQVQKYETGMNRLSVGKLMTLLKAYGLTLEEFLAHGHKDGWDTFQGEPKPLPPPPELPITVQDIIQGLHERKMAEDEKDKVS
jgi:transcriptional regulator with XRE-family HTH domain